MKSLPVHLLFVFILSASSAVARIDYGANPSAFRLDLAEGIVDSSVVSALWQNPAGISRNAEGKVSGGLLSSSSSLSPFNYSLGYLTGNGSVGGALALGGSTGDSSTLNHVRLGLAAEFPSAKFSLGFTGAYSIDDRSTDGNLGLIFNPSGDLRVGAVAYQVAGGPDTYGAGIAYDPSYSATIAVDASADRRLKGLRLKPALGVRAGDFHLTAGYGFSIEDSSSSGSISKGFCAGVGYALDYKLFFAATLRQAEHYRFELTLRL
jgi:hypothetical protein